MQKHIKLFCLGATMSLITMIQVNAAVTAVDLGTAIPPTVLGGYAMDPFDPGSISGATQASVGSGWATWGQGYTGHVYYRLDNSPLTITLSPGTVAVYFYEEPNRFSDFLMTATDSSGASVSTVINGYYGSSGVGFYTDTGSLSSIVVTSTDTTGFAVGEFGISHGGSLTGHIGSVPDAGSTLGLLSAVMFGLGALRRKLMA